MVRVACPGIRSNGMLDRLGALRVLKDKAPEIGLEHFSVMLKDPTPEIRCMTLKMIKKLREPRYKSLALPLVRDPEAMARHLALHVIAGLYCAGRDGFCD